MAFLLLVDGEDGESTVVSKVYAVGAGPVGAEALRYAAHRDLRVERIMHGALPDGRHLASLIAFRDGNNEGTGGGLAHFAAYLHGSPVGPSAADEIRSPKGGVVRVLLGQSWRHLLLVTNDTGQLLLCDPGWPSEGVLSSAGPSYVISPVDGLPFAVFPPSPNGHGLEYVPRPSVAWARMVGGDPLDNMIEYVGRLIESGECPFPYKRAYTSQVQVLTWFSSLVRLSTEADLSRAPFELHGVIHARGAVQCITRGLESGEGGELYLRHPQTVWVHLGPTAADGPGLVNAKKLMDVGPAFKPFDRVHNEAGGEIVDYFTERARMAARRRDAPLPPEEEWRLPEAARAIVDRAIGKYGEVTERSLRRGQYGVLNSVCNIFHANLARSLIYLLGGTRMLDPCAGWGDRLIGAMACPGVTRYLAFDPNAALVEGHAEIVRTFSHLAPGKGRYEVVCAPFEDGRLPIELFNLVLTSPPYFDLEIYTGCGQSIARAAGGLEGWLVSWYCPMLEKAWDSLQEGGHLAIYINDHVVREDRRWQGQEDLHICGPMLQHAASLPSCEWVGALGIEGETQSVRPLWVWRKGGLSAEGYGRAGTRVPPLYAALTRLFP